MLQRLALILLLLSCCICSSTDLCAQEKPAQPSPRVDLYGDPLPEGAIARFGTVRFRHRKPITGTAYSPDGKLLAGLSKDELVLWDTKSGQAQQRLQVEPYTTGRFVQFSLDSQRIHAMSMKNQIVSYRVSDGRILGLLTLKPLRDPEEVGVWLTSDERFLLVLDKNLLSFYDFTTKTELASVECRAESRLCQLTPDGKTFVVAESNLIHCYQPSTGRLLRSWTQEEDERIKGIAIALDNTTLLHVTDDHVHFTDLKSMRTLRDPVKVEDSGGLWHIVLSPDGKSFLSLNDDGSLILYDSETAKMRKRLSISEMAGTDLQFSPDGKRLLFRGNSTHTRGFWDLVNDEELYPAGLGFTTTPWDIHWHPSSERFFASTIAGNLWEWDRASSKRVRALLPGLMLPVYRRTAISPNGKVLAATADIYGKTLNLYDTKTGSPLLTLSKTDKYYSGFTWSPDGNWFAAGFPSEIQIFDAQIKKMYTTLPIASESCLAFSSDSTKLLCQSWSERAADGITIYNTHSWAKAGNLLPLTKEPDYHTAFSNEGLYCFTRSGDHIACRELASGLSYRWSDAISEFQCDGLAISPNGRLMVYTKRNAIYIRDAWKAQQLHTLISPSDSITTLSFSPDGKHLLTGSHDTTLLLWDMQPYYAKLAIPAGKLTAQELADCWRDLQGKDLKLARQASFKLCGDPSVTVAFLQEKLKPVPVHEAAKLAQLVSELEHEEFAVREKADAALRSLVNDVSPQLRVLHASTKSVQVRFTLQEILAGSETLLSPGETLTQIRCLFLLKQISTPAAKKLVERLATGNPKARATQQAKYQLSRWEK